MICHMSYVISSIKSHIITIYLVGDQLSCAHLRGLLVGEGADGEGQGGEPPVDLVKEHPRRLDLAGWGCRVVR